MLFLFSSEGAESPYWVFVFAKAEVESRTDRDSLSLYDALRSAIETAYPRECCGVLLGRRDGARLIVQRVVSTLNAVNTTAGFAIPDQEMRRVRVLAAEAGLRIVAVFSTAIPAAPPKLSSSDRVRSECTRNGPGSSSPKPAAPGEVVLTWFNQVT